MIKFFFRGKNPPSFLFLIFLSFYAFVNSQEITINGVVSFEGVPLPGVAVLNENTTTGAITDFDGRYDIKASPNDKITFSYTGFKKINHTVKEGESKVDIVMQEDTQSLDEVVVIAYGTTTKEELVGSVASVKAEEIEKVQAISFEQAIQGRASGVRVVASEGGPGAGLKVNVRNNTSFLANSDPLYVVDGFPILTDTEGNSNNNTFGGGFTSPLASLDPSTIESIEILKDATSTGPYGARGANGVVLITTKTGKAGKPKFSFDTSIGVQTVARQVDHLNTQEFINLYNELVPGFADGTGQITNNDLFYRDELGNPVSIGGGSPRLLNQLNPNTPGEFYRPVGSIDWKDAIFREAITRKTSLNITGGNDKMKYLANVSYTNQEGVVKNTDFKRYAFNLRTNSTINDRFKVDVGFNGSFIERGGIVTASRAGSAGILSSGLINNLGNATPGIARDFQRSIDESGEEVLIERDPATNVVVNVGGEFRTNPLLRIQKDINETKSFVGNLNTGFSYKLAKGLTFRANFGGRTNVTYRKAYFNREFGQGQKDGGKAILNNRYSWSWSNDNILNYDFTLGKNHFISDLIYSHNRNVTETNQSESINFLSDFTNVDAVNRGLPNTTSSSRSGSAQRSGIFRQRYDFAKKYFLTGSLRADQSSRFTPSGPGQLGYFWTLGGKWVASKENFMKNIAVVKNLELKASYGTTGNDRIPFNSSYSSLSNTLARAIQLFQPENNGLKWETTKQLDLGVSIGLFPGRRVNLQFDYFRKVTEDLLYFKELEASKLIKVQFGTLEQNERFGIYDNSGQISSEGYEIALGVDIIDNKDFNWNVNANITFSKATIDKLGDNSELVLKAPYEINRINDDTYLGEGAEVGTYYGFQRDGLYQYSDFVEFDGLTPTEQANLYIRGGSSNNTDLNTLRTLEENTIQRGGGNQPTSNFTLKPGVARFGSAENFRPGMPKYKDQNGDGIIDEEDRTIIGNAQPDHFGGISNNFRYKNFDFSFLMNWSYGNDIYNLNRYVLLYNDAWGRAAQNLAGELRNRWTPYNTNTDVPALSTSGNLQGAQNVIPDDSLIEDGSFLRLSNISVGYNLDSRHIKNLGLSNLKLYAAIDNVYVWTNDYSGYDPEVSVGNQQLFPGIDFGSYPRARTFRFGVKGTF